MTRTNNRKAFYGSLELVYQSLAAAIRMEFEGKTRRFGDYAVRVAAAELEKADLALAAAQRPATWVLDASVAQAHIQGTQKHIEFLRGARVGETSVGYQDAALRATNFQEYMQKREAAMRKKAKTRRR